jgi:hypothetical protein
LFDNGAKFETVCSRIGIDPSKGQALRLRLLRLAADLQAARTIADIAGPRRQQIARFKTLSKQLERTTALLGLRNPAYQQVLTNLWSPLIARYLSSYAIDETRPHRRVAEVERWEVGHYGSRNFGDPSDLDNTEFNYVPPAGGFEALLASKRRDALGPTVTPYLVHVLGQLLKELANALAEERRSDRAKGGNPGDRWRAYIIEKLMTIYIEFTGKEATGSLEGPFETLCRYALAELGMTHTGLADAIGRVLYPRNLGR